MVEVAAKYEMFGDNDKTKVELKLFITNLDQIKVELGKIEEKIAGIPNANNEFLKDLIKLNEDIQSINARYTNILKRIKPAEFKISSFSGQTRINSITDIGFKLTSSRKALISFIQIIRQIYGEITLDVYNNNKKLIHSSSTNQNSCTSGPFTWSLPPNDAMAIFYFHNLIIEAQVELFFHLRFKSSTKIDCFTAYDVITEEKSIFTIIPTVKIYKTSTVYPGVIINYC